MVDVLPYGDRALLVRLEDVPSAHRLAAVVKARHHTGSAPEGIEETVVGLSSVVVILRPGTETEPVASWLRTLGDPASGSGPGQQSRDSPPPRIEVPVAFDGPDLAAVADIVGLTPDAVVAELTGTDLTVAFLGFAPGFPYLVGLPPSLASVPRRPSPRTRVPAGSVAVAGGFASVYPQSTPGGWMLLGRTPLALFDAHRPPFAVLAPGDTVRFTVDRAGGGGPTAGGGPGQGGSSRHGRQPAPPRAPLEARGPRLVEVTDPGVLSLVEDGGRRSVAGVGVPVAGPADADSMRLANRLMGNPDDDAVIEVAMVGPRLRFGGDGFVTVVACRPGGVEVAVDGRPVADAAVTPVRDGQELGVGRVLTGVRAYVAVAGGFTPGAVMGSRSDDILSGLGPGPLAAGDRVALGPSTRPRGQILPVSSPDPTRPVILRVVLGPHRPPGTEEILGDDPWAVGVDSDRVGVRLTRPRGDPRPHEMAVPSFGMVTGAIQLPSNGAPIILGPDHATVGGYPVVACVIVPDLPRVGQLRPGDEVVFTVVDRPTAHAAFRRHERLLSERVIGWFPTESGV